MTAYRREKGERRRTPRRLLLPTTAMASAAVLALGDNAQARTPAQSYAAADVPTPAAAPARPEAGEVAAAEVSGRPQDVPAGPAGQTARCDGDGSTGNRVQVGYVHGPDRDRYSGPHLVPQVGGRRRPHPRGEHPGDRRHPTHPLRDGRGLRADHVSNRPHYGARLLDLQRADGRATQVWTVQKVG